MNRNSSRFCASAFSGPVAAMVLLAGPVRGVAAHGTHDERVRIFAARLKIDPSDVGARHELALAHLENGDWQRALAELEIADHRNPPDSGMDFSVTRARALVIGGRIAVGREVLNTFLTKNPDHPGGLLERARILDTLKMPSASLTDYRKVLEVSLNLEPDFYLEMADKLAAQKLENEAIGVVQKGIGAKGQIPSLVLRAVDLEIAVGRFDDALMRVDSMAKLMPRPEPWMAKRASVLAQAGRLDESMAGWRALKERIKSLPEAERRSAAMTTLATEVGQAISALSATAKFNP